MFAKRTAHNKKPLYLALLKVYSTLCFPGTAGTAGKRIGSSSRTSNLPNLPTNKQMQKHTKKQIQKEFFALLPPHLAPNVVGKSLQGLSTLGDQSGAKMMHQERTHLTAKLLNAFSLKLCGNGSSRSCRRSHGEEVAEVEEEKVGEGDFEALEVEGGS